MSETPEKRELRRGWTTGACAAAAAKAAYQGWISKVFPDPVTLHLPGGQRPAFALARAERLEEGARAGIVKDAGDDPDVTHGALILVDVRKGLLGRGVSFKAGVGVGRVTKPGLPLAIGEPAINPMPREMIRTALAEARAAVGGPTDVEVTISIPGGADIAKKTLNPRLGIIGGLSILGTTGIVIPFSCAAWIHSIHRGIDVARACGLTHVAGSTGSTSEEAIRRLHGLPEEALIEMGDFAGGMLKYLRQHPVAKVTVAGGFAKMVKLAQGLTDLHSRAGQVDFAWLSEEALRLGAPLALADQIGSANTAAEVMHLASTSGIALAERIAEGAWATAASVLGPSDIALEIVVFDRHGQLVARTPFRKTV